MDRIDPAELPSAITRYLTAQRARQAGSAIGVFTPDAVVTDDGKTYTGIDEIAAWLSSSSSEFTYTTELTAAHRVDDAHWVAVNHLAGNFPGGQVDLRFQFTLRDGLIAALTIEP